jgi:hypothetical protein
MAQCSFVSDRSIYHKLVNRGWCGGECGQQLNEEAAVSYGIVLRFEGVGEKDYWAVNSALGISRDGAGEWPDGMRSHVGGPTPDGWVVMELWESKSAHEAFMAGRLGAALGSVGLPAPVQIIETDTVNEYTNS